jgi:hypothetical protein
VEQGVLNERQVQHILRVQRQCNRPFGDLAERLFGISARAVADAWVEQYVRVAGVVDLEELKIDRRCLRVLSNRQAWQFHLLPVHQEDNGELQMATCAQHLVRALNFSTRSIDRPVFMRIAQRVQLREFLMRHYPVPGYIAQYSQVL